MVMMEVFRSAVNVWECDQMGHLNVRHYFGRANDGLSLMLLELGLSATRLRKEGLALRAIDQHVRFHRELRPGTPFNVLAGVVRASAEALHTYQEISIPPQAELSATILTEANLIELSSGRPRAFPAQLTTLSQARRVEVPPHGAARGISRDAPRPPLTRNQAIERGLIGAYLGPVFAEDCDANGLMREAGMMAKISDGVAHFLRAARARPVQAGLGGAALEYRFAFRSWPRQGDIIEVRSGLKGLGNKTQNICHFVFDFESGECLASTEAVVVSFDLNARRAVPISSEARAALEPMIIPGLSL
jgi:acyl-CoA thioester hydrolase